MKDPNKIIKREEFRVTDMVVVKEKNEVGNTEKYVVLKTMGANYQLRWVAYAQFSGYALDEIKEGHYAKNPKGCNVESMDYSLLEKTTIGNVGVGDRFVFNGKRFTKISNLNGNNVRPHNPKIKNDVYRIDPDCVVWVKKEN